MTNLRNYTRQYTLSEVLTAMGISSFASEELQSVGFNLGFLKFKRDFEKNRNTFSFSLTKDSFGIIKRTLLRDLEVYVHGFDTNAQIKNSSSYITVLLSNSNTLVYNCGRIYKFLKNREKRYEKLLNFISPIKQKLKNENKEQKLNLRLNSLNEIPKSNKLQYNRLLDDIITNLAEM